MHSALPQLLASRRLARRKGHAGMVMPVALGASLLLLLSGGSLQMLALQARSQLSVQQRRLQLEDTLASAAQQQVAALQTQGACLLGLELSRWSTDGTACGIAAAALDQLRQGQLGTQGYRVVAYRPQVAVGMGQFAELELQLDADHPWRAAYRLSLEPGANGTLQIIAVQDLGLRGAGA